MDLTPYVDALRDDLQAAAAAGTEQTQETARLLSAALDPSLRLCLVDALSALAAEVSDATDLAVEIRMHGREPQVVVNPAGPPQPAGAPMLPPAEDDADSGTARITLRLPDALKAQAEQRAAAEGLSVNAWLVRAVTGAVHPHPPTVTSHPGERRITGFARS
ncbi:MAG: YlcI/YnfO family protein [Acidimicrobiales bacterium]